MGCNSSQVSSSKRNSCLTMSDVPPAPRPEWLPASGPGLANVPPVLWSLSIEQWIFLIHVCIETDTWKALVEVKGEYNITMYDIKNHFVVPWTRGTGCSIALLMNSAKQHAVELMLSHAWGGSVIETYNCLQNLVNDHGVPPSTHVFYCVFSMYQPEDGCELGLTISEQLQLRPFAQIIESNPKYGMFVIHTTTFEVYSRMWTVHEVDEGSHANITMVGLFDKYRWTMSRFDAAIAIHTKEGECRPEDLDLLDELIVGRGGYERLDDLIANFRSKMRADLAKAIEPREDGHQEVSSGAVNSDGKFDWTKSTDWCGMTGVSSSILVWHYTYTWETSMKGVCGALGSPLVRTLPLGDASYPLGPPHITASDKVLLEWLQSKSFIRDIKVGQSAEYALDGGSKELEDKWSEYMLEELM